MKYFQKLIWEKVYLSPLNPDDCEVFAKWNNDHRITDWTHWTPRMITLKVQKEYLEEASSKKDSYQFAIVKKRPGAVGHSICAAQTAAVFFTIKLALAYRTWYNRYEISNYAKKGRECRHNIGYWQRKEYLGFGVGAASLYKGERYNNTDDVYCYMNSLYYYFFKHSFFFFSVKPLLHSIFFFFI